MPSRPSVRPRSDPKRGSQQWMSGVPVEIVSLRPEHVESLHATLDRVAKERHYLALLEAPPLASTRTFLEKSIAAGNPHYVALDGPHVVGWCDIQASDRPVMRHGGMLGMGLLPELRGQRLGARLMRVALDDAWVRGFMRVALTVRHDNARAIRLYQAMGFALEGRLRRAMRI